MHLIQWNYYLNIIQYINNTYYLQLLTIYNTYYKYYTFSNCEIKSY